jgi:hypothetical protein
MRRVQLEYLETSVAGSSSAGGHAIKLVSDTPAV